MKTTISLANFDVNAALHTVIVNAVGVPEFNITFDYAYGEEFDNHKITIANGEAINLHAQAQAKIILAAADMIDSHYDGNDDESYTETTLDA